MWPAVPFYIVLNSAMELLLLRFLVFWNWDTDHVAECSHQRRHLRCAARVDLSRVRRGTPLYCLSPAFRGRHQTRLDRAPGREVLPGDDIQHQLHVVVPVHLAREEIEPSLQFDSFDRSIWRNELLRWNEIGNVLDDRGSFREQCSISSSASTTRS